MKTIAEWLTTERRQLIQAFIGSLATIAVVFGFASQGTADQWVIVLGAVLQFLLALLALVNVRIADWSTQGWAIARAAVYALATTVSPAFTLLGFYNDQINGQVLGAVSLGLSSLSSLIAIFAAGKQQQVVASDVATVEALSAPLAEQIVGLHAAAARLGIDPADVSRALYREAAHDDSTL